MLLAIRFVASLAILLWGVATVVLGVASRNLPWIPLGLAIALVGLPLLASHPSGGTLIHLWTRRSRGT